MGYIKENIIFDLLYAKYYAISQFIKNHGVALSK